MGQPILIKDIAVELIKLSGFTPEVDIPIDYIGLRPGEKMFEELMTQGENITDSPHEKIMILKNEVKQGWSRIIAESEKVIESSKSFNSDLVKESLMKIVPEYSPTTQKNNNFDFYKKKNQKI